MKLIELKNISKYYRSEEVVSLGMKDVSLSFNLGEFIGITGPSGSGKSTLLNVVSGLDSYDEGEMYINGEETSHFTISDWENFRGKNIGFIFQNYNIIDSYTVLQNVMLALEVSNIPRHLIKERALELIDRVGLTKHKNKKATKLSGGEKQRCVIARALAKDCPIIVADEPTGNLDSTSGQSVMELLYELSKDKLVLVVTHNFSEIAPYATRRIQMNDGYVESDVTLKSTETVKTNHTEMSITNKMSLKNNIRFSLRNLFATPKKFFLFIVLQMLVMFSLVSYYGNILYNVEQNSNLFIQTTTTERRVMVKNKNNELIKTGQYEGILSIYDTSEFFYDSANLSIVSSTDSWGAKYIYKRASYDELSIDLQSKMIGLNDVVLTKDLMDDLKEGKYSLMISENDLIQRIDLNVVGLIKGESTIYFSSSFLSQTPTILENQYQSIVFKNRQAAEKFIQQVDKTQNIILYEYTNINEFSKIQNIIIVGFMGMGFVLIAIFLYFIILVVLRNVMSSRKKDFGIFRSIGINKSTLGKTIVIEQLFLSLVSFISTMVFFYVKDNVLSSGNSIYDYIDFGQLILLLVIFFILAARLAINFNKKIFNISVIETLTEGRSGE